MRPRHINFAGIFFLSVTFALLTSCGSSSNYSTPVTQPTRATQPNSVPEDHFNVSPSNPTFPADVLREVSFYVGGAGNLQCSSEGFSGLAIFHRSLPESPELQESVWVHTCGWSANESVEMTLRLPNGQTFSKVISMNNATIQDGQLYAFYDSLDGAIVLGYRTNLGDPAGNYTFVFHGNSGRLEHSINVRQPNGPRVYEDGNQLLLYNFRSNESVRLFAYQATDISWASGHLTGWGEYRVGSRGNLLLNLSGSALSNLLLCHMARSAVMPHRGLKKCLKTG